ncbi:hypothetical protein RRG08_001076 [Elysia crispata]|uniref:Uncharacterized protein n=1 Tax=Elysia crispata TaxID=231223 RepID=A0AAE1AWF3_9GAST|nr:hypothetical protein RRG08_001076 [Elysia crispata]
MVTHAERLRLFSQGSPAESEALHRTQQVHIFSQGSYNTLTDWVLSASRRAMSRQSGQSKRTSDERNKGEISKDGVEMGQTS